MKYFLILSVILISYSSVEAQDAEKLNGEWYGSYYCTQGETGLHLSIKARSNSKIKGTFTFFPVSSNQSAKPGKFSFTGSISDEGVITLIQNEWIIRPEYYLMVDLKGKLIAPNIFEGEITTSGCEKFRVTKIDD